ncbi:unnamed protein product [Closterium sp. Naga37s-1]|nr:unnamed protein product [Closterium sp. Naga37s-1]
MVRKKGGSHRSEGRNRTREDYLLHPPESIIADPPPPSSPGHESDEDSHAEATVAATAGKLEEDELKFVLYQRAVQSPRGDISYLLKFFLNYVGGRVPQHLHEDFCGTALICAEWLRGDPRRTALGLDFDEQALSWGIRENFSSLPGSARGRACMLLGDVRDPLTSARFACPDVLDEPECENKQSSATREVQDSGEGDVAAAATTAVGPVWPQLERLRQQRADLICAFNFSSCCLLHRSELLAYFKSARTRLAGAGGGSAGEGVAESGAGSGGGGGGGGGGVFAMDLYGGTSSEGALKLHRRYGDMDYTWEQERFDAVTRTTRISLHFRVPHDWAPASSSAHAADSTARRGGRKRQQPKRVLRSAFSYSWRL